jgi:protease-4
MGFAKAREIQDALADFKTTGKFIYAYMEVGRENEYYNALAADKIFMPNQGIIEFNGFSANSVFLKGFFNKFGIDFFVSQFEDFKSAGESLSRNNFSDSAKLQLKVLLEARNNEFIQAVAKFRHIDEAIVANALNRGIYTTDSLKELGLIDDFAMESEVKQLIKQKVYNDNAENVEDKSLKLISVANYITTQTKSKANVYDKNTQIAIIYGVGQIQSNESNNIMSNEQVIASKSFIKYLKKARENSEVKAIIIRVDSPGGTITASDEIWREILITKKVKPVYCSMSDVAASGGYYMAIPCDTIVCHPLTITGSIGVVSVVPNVSGLLNKLSITTDEVATSPAASFMNPTKALSEEDKAKFINMSSGFYKSFVSKVAEARHKSFEETRSIAKGRVWIGSDAKKLGLVDTLGGINTAIGIAKRRLGIPDSMLVYIKTYPEQKDEFEAIMKLFNLSTDDQNDEDAEINLVAKLFGVDKNMISDVLEAMPADIKEQLSYSLGILRLSKKEKVLMTMPYYIR